MSLKPTFITLLLANKLSKVSKHMFEDVLVRVGKFIYPVYFIILETKSIAD